MFINSCLKHPLIKRAIMTSFVDNIKQFEPDRAGNDTNIDNQLYLMGVTRYSISTEFQKLINDSLRKEQKIECLIKTRLNFTSKFLDQTNPKNKRLNISARMS